MRLLALLTVTVVAVLSACNDEEPQQPTSVATAPAGAKVVPSCHTGQRSRYFERPPTGATVVGCARLAGGHVVEVSANPARFRGPPKGRSNVCLNVQYSPVQGTSSCPPRAALDRTDIEVYEVEQPRQGRETKRLDLGLVVSGAVSPEAREVTVRYGGGGEAQAAAAVIRVRRELASRVGAKGEFGYFIAELPVEAACNPIRVAAAGIGEDSVPPDQRMCERGG